MAKQNVKTQLSVNERNIHGACLHFVEVFYFCGKTTQYAYLMSIVCVCPLPPCRESHKRSTSLHCFFTGYLRKVQIKPIKWHTCALQTLAPTPNFQNIHLSYLNIARWYTSVTHTHSPDSYVPTLNSSAKLFTF